MPLLQRAGGIAGEGGGVNIDIPETVSVGPYRYVVKIEEGPFIGDGNASLCGEANHNAGLIRVMQAVPERMFVTFWHEVLHAIDDVAGTELGEDAINRLAPILAGVLIDNGYVERKE